MALRSLLSLLLRLCHDSNIAKGELTSSPLKSVRNSTDVCHSRLERESSSRKAGYFATGLSRLRACFRFIKSRIRNLSHIAGKAGYFATDLSRLRACFRFIKSRIRNLSHIAGKACYFAADLPRLKSCFRFIKSRVRQISRVAIPSPVGGFGLVETLVMAGVGLTLGMGMLRIAQVSVSSAQVSNTALAEQSLQTTVRKILSSPVECRFNLKPARRASNGDITDPSDSNKLLIYTGATTDAETTDPALQSKHTDLVTKGAFKNGLISVLKINFTAPDFKVYYSKPRLGEFSTLGDGKCDTTDDSGCYILPYTVNYGCADPNETPPACSTLPPNCLCLDCASRQDFAGGNCDPGEYVKGLNPDGSPVCSESEGDREDLACGEGEALSITRAEDEAGKVTITKACVKTQASQNCEESGFLIIGFNADGTPECGKPCFDGKVWNKTSKVCECTGGRTVLNVISKMCECPGSKPKWNVAEQLCEACGEGKIYDSSSKTCKCDRYHKTNTETGECILKCGRGDVFVEWDEDSQKCVCPYGGRVWDADSQRCVCPPGTNAPHITAFCISKGS